MRLASFITTLIVIFIGFSGITTLISVPVDAAEIPANDLNIDEHWLFIYQQDDHRSLEVTENIFYNNTGSSTYSDDIYFWLPANAEIFAACCGGSPDMMCIIRPDDSHACFNPTSQLDINVVVGNPFNIITPYLTYYGQVDNFTVEAYFDEIIELEDNATGTVNRTQRLDFDVELGGSSAVRPEDNSSEFDIKLDSDLKTLGAVWKAEGKSYFINIEERLKVTNYSDHNYTVNLSIMGLPEGWFVSVLDNNSIIKHINMTGNTSKDLIVYVSVPSYEIAIQIEYRTKMDISGGDLVKGIFEKVELYETDSFIPVVYQLEDDELAIDTTFVKMFNEYDDEYKRSKSYYVRNDVNADEKMSMSLSWEVDDSSVVSDLSGTLPVIILIIVALLIGILIVVIRRSRARSYEDDEEDYDEDDDDRVPSSAVLERAPDRNVKYKKALRKLEAGYASGRVPEDVYIELKSKYNSKLGGHVDAWSGSSPDIDELESKKVQMLHAIKKLKSDYKAGEIPEDIYESLSKDYRRKTVEIMKEIERAQ